MSVPARYCSHLQELARFSAQELRDLLQVCAKAAQLRSCSQTMLGWLSERGVVALLLAVTLTNRQLNLATTLVCIRRKCLHLRACQNCQRWASSETVMKNLIGVIILAVLCVGLGIVLFTTKKQAEEEKATTTNTILSLSNDVVKTSGYLTEQQQVNTMLTNDLTVVRTEFAKLTNKFTDVAATLTKTEASLKASQTAVAERDQKIAALETQNRELDEKAIDLSAALTNLTTQISETQRKLAASEGDKAFLEQELKRLMVEKAELERQFNDLAILRAQVSKLKEELSVARRLEWIRKGLFAADEQKGAQKLMNVRNQSQPTNTNIYDLNVEVESDGTVKVIPPLTNAPAAKP
jgi:hypothetical protein